MKCIPILALTLIVAARGASAQYNQTEYARIEHRKGSAVLSVLSYGRPLLSGLVAVRQEYGWTLDLEQVMCSESRGAERFESTYPEDATVRAGFGLSSPTHVYSVPASSENVILRKIVSDYNRSDPVCRYSVIRQRDGNYAVTTMAVRKSDGTYDKVTPLLSTAISVSRGDYIDAITRSISASTGIRVVLYFPSDTGFSPKSRAALNGNARDVLSTMVPGIEWDLYCGEREHACFLNLSSSRRVQYDQSGHRYLVP